MLHHTKSALISKHFRTILVTLGLLALYIFIHSKLLFLKPHIWPDEPIYFDIARNIFSGRGVNTSLWQGLIPGVETLAAWNPPLFFFGLSSWLSIFGFTLTAQRTFSIFLGALSLIVVFLVSKPYQTKAKTFWLFLPVIALIADWQFMRAARISRPEIQTLLFVLLSFLFLQNTIQHFKSQRSSYPERSRRTIHDTRSRLHSKLYLTLTGFCLSLAILTHPISALFVFPVAATLITHFSQTKKHLPNFLVAFFSPLFLWIASTLPNITIISSQLQLASNKKFLDTPWIIDVFQKPNLLLQINYLLFIAALVLISKHIIINDRKLLSPLFFLITSWLVFIFGRMFWYVVYILPFTYLLLAQTTQSKNAPKHLVRIFAALIFINTLYTSIDLAAALKSNFDYQQFSQEVASFIPIEHTVFISAIPDPYYGFISLDRTNPIIEFPPYQLPTDQYFQVLEDVDTIIVSGNQDFILFGDYLFRYLNLNTKSVQEVTSPPHQVQIHTLIEPDKRVSP